MRAIAVMAVLLYHADIAPVSGGYVGVDIFFVISGYLIMSTLAADMEAGRYSIAAFYERRVRRILPALFGVTLFCCVAAALLFTPGEFRYFGQSLIALALFASNLFFCFEPHEAAGYFATTDKPELLLHSWSLAVEEQFYILLPIGLAILWRFGRRVTIGWLIGLTIGSFGLSLWAVSAWPLGAFYLVFFRAWELLIGSLLALGVAPPLPNRALREAAAALGLALIIVPVFTYTRETPFPGLTALPPCFGAWLIIHASSLGCTVTARLLALPPLVGIGLISYSLYLWHWPIAVLLKQLNMGRLTAVPTAFIIVASFVAGILSYRFIERPFRGKGALFSRRQLFAVSASGGFAALLAGSVAVASDGLPQRFDQQTRRLIEANVAREHDRPATDCENWQTPVRTQADIFFCPIGAGASRNILFWGDSHAGGLRALVQRLHDENALGGRVAVFAVSAGCLPVLRPTNSLPDYHCQAFSRLTLERAKATDIDTVFIGFSPIWELTAGNLCLARDDRCQRSLSRADQEDLVIEDLRAEVKALRQAAKKVVIALPVPSYSRSVPQFEINRIILGRAYQPASYARLVPDLKRNDYAPLRARLVALAAETGAKLFDPAASLCHAGTCLYERNGVSLYTDDNHLASSQTGILHDGLRDALR